MDLSDLLFEDKPSVAEEGDEEKGVKKHEPVEVPDPSIHPKSVRKHKKNAGLDLWNKVQGQEAEEVEDDILETEPKQVDVVDDAQNAPEEKAVQDRPFQNEPELNIEIEEEPGTWYYEFEVRVLGAKTKEEYLSLLLEKHEKLSEEYRDRNSDLEEGELNSNLRQFRNLRSSKVQDIEVEFDLLNKVRGIRKQVLSREGPYAVSHEESEEQNTRDARRRLGVYITGGSSYEERINRVLEEVDQKILSSKRKIYDILIKYPGKSSGFSTPIASTKTSKEHVGPDPAKSGVVTSLNKVIERAIKASGEMFVDDPDGLEQYIAELENDHRNYGFKITKIVAGALNAKQAYDDEVSKASSEEEISADNYNKWLDLSRQANELLSEFRDKYDPKKQEKPLDDSEFRDQNWYSKKFGNYMLEASTLPGAPVSIGDSLKRLSDRSKFISSTAKYPDINQVIDDKSLINQVIRGVKPLAHTKTHRREIKLGREKSQQIAYVLAPVQMGGGVIWYRPEQRAGERAYDERILGLNPEADKEDRPSSKPFNPMSKDANLNIVELYIWNNIANRSDSRLYNFINGLCLGYPRDYVIWFCESKYGQVDNRQPERSFWGRMLDRFRYSINAGVNGYGRPGSIKPDGMFSTVFKLLTPNFINDWINQILGTSDVSSPQKSFASTVGEFEPTRAPERTEFESVETRDPIIESIYNKLDNL